MNSADSILSHTVRELFERDLPGERCSGDAFEDFFTKELIAARVIFCPNILMDKSDNPILDFEGEEKGSFILLCNPPRNTPRFVPNSKYERATKMSLVKLGAGVLRQIHSFDSMPKETQSFIMITKSVRNRAFNALCQKLGINPEVEDASDYAMPLSPAQFEDQEDREFTRLIRGLFG